MDSKGNKGGFSGLSDLASNVSGVDETPRSVPELDEKKPPATQVSPSTQKATPRSKSERKASASPPLLDRFLWWGGPWKWIPDPGNDRGGVWRDPSGKSANWDPSGHWDVWDKDGTRKRYDRWGNETDRHRNPSRKPSDKPIIHWPTPKFNPWYWIPNPCILEPTLCNPNWPLEPPDMACSGSDTNS